MTKRSGSWDSGMKVVRASGRWQSLYERFCRPGEGGASPLVAWLRFHSLANGIASVDGPMIVGGASRPRRVGGGISLRSRASSDESAPIRCGPDSASVRAGWAMTMGPLSSRARASLVIQRCSRGTDALEATARTTVRAEPDRTPQLGRRLERARRRSDERRDRPVLVRAERVDELARRVELGDLDVVAPRQRADRQLPQPHDRCRRARIVVSRLGRRADARQHGRVRRRRRAVLGVARVVKRVRLLVLLLLLPVRRRVRLDRRRRRRLRHGQAQRLEVLLERRRHVAGHGSCCRISASRTSQGGRTAWAHNWDSARNTRAVPREVKSGLTARPAASATCSAIRQERRRESGVGRQRTKGLAGRRPTPRKPQRQREPSEWCRKDRRRPTSPTICLEDASTCSRHHSERVTSGQRAV